MTAVATGTRWLLNLDPSWRSFTGIQGGMVVGQLLAAAAAEAGAAPRAVTAHLLRPVAAGRDAVVTAGADRAGTTGSIRAELVQDGGLAAVAQVLTVARPVSPGVPVAGPTLADGEPFQLPRELVPIADHTGIRALGSSRPLAGGKEPRLHAWVRIDGLSDPLVQLGVLVDALPPSLFAVWTAPRAVPTVELTAHLAGPPPAPGAWVRIDQRTTWHGAGLAVDDADVWSEDGVLVARVRQTRRLLG
jgi:acyl-Coa thioesterase superfamily protein/acyl-CoA thioesterase superfamily protein